MKVITFSEMANLQAGSRIKDVATGFCVVGGLFNVVLGIGCGIWGLYEYLK